MGFCLRRTSPLASVYFRCEPTHLRDTLGFNLTVKTAADTLPFVLFRQLEERGGDAGTKGREREGERIISCEDSGKLAQLHATQH